MFVYTYATASAAPAALFNWQLSEVLTTSAGEDREQLRSLSFLPILWRLMHAYSTNVAVWRVALEVGLKLKSFDNILIKHKD